MSQNNCFVDHENIQLEVTLKSGISYEGLNCIFLRIYLEKYNTCDGHALISIYTVNGLKDNGEIIKPEQYSSFRDRNGEVWQIHSYKMQDPPQVGYLFCLLKS